MKSSPIIPPKINLMKRMTSSILRHRDTSVLNQPVSLEDSIPSDLLLQSERKPFDFHSFIKHLATRYIRSTITRFLVLFSAILSCVLYVVETYVDQKSYRLFSFITDVLIFSLFITDYIFNILYVSTKWKYILSSQGMIDLLSLLSIINVFVVGTDLSFLPLFRLLRVIKILRFFLTVSIMMNVDRPRPPSASEAILFEIASLVVTLILAVFLSASLLYTLVQQDPHSFLFTPNPDIILSDHMTFFDCIYVVLVIVATLGFGDFVPANFLGRLFVVLLLSSTVILIPAKVSQLVDTIGKKPRYMNSYIAELGQAHIVIFANLTQENFQRLISLILAEGTNNAEIVEDAVPIALMSSVQPSSQLQLLLVHPLNSRKVQFFVGSAKSQIDLARVCACDAKAILVFNDHDISDSLEVVDQDDYSTKLKVVSIVNFLSHELALRKQTSRPVIISQTYSHEVCTSLLNFGVDRIVSSTNMKYSLLAYASLFPGFLSIFASLTIPSTIYNKPGSTSDPTKWKNEYEWGNSFELIEIPIRGNTSADIQRLSFSQTCRFLYERSRGTSICVAVAGLPARPGVVINPERRARIGDCRSLFVICNDLDLTLEMLMTENLRSVLRKLRSKREFGSKAKRTFLHMSTTIVEPTEEIQLQDHHPEHSTLSFPRNRTSTSVSVPEVHLSLANSTSITFRRHPNCYKKEYEIPETLSVDSPVSIEVQPPIQSPVQHESKTPEDHPNEHITTSRHVPIVRIHSNILLQDYDYRPRSDGRHATEYSIISQPAIRIDKKEFISHRRFKEHTVLVCAFSPQYPIPRIVSAVETFVNACRTKSGDMIVVLAARAIEIEAFIQQRVKERNETFDSSLLFIQGLPNSVRGLQSADVCHARCIVIIGNEYTAKETETKDENKEVNRDLYIVLSALELDTIFKYYIKLLKTNNKVVSLPLVIQELYNESTATFLPDIYQIDNKRRTSSTNVWESYEKKPMESGRGLKHSKHSGLYDDDEGISENSKPQMLRQKSEFRQSYENYRHHRQVKALHKSFIHSYIPNPAYSQGRVLIDSIIDSFTVQMLYNHNLNEFWQVVMGMRKDTDPYPPSELDPFQQGKFDELEIPKEFKGTFGELFQYLLTCYGTIAVGLFRFPESQSSYVVVLPPQDSMVLPNDRAMVFITKRPTDLSAIPLGHEAMTALHDEESVN